MRNGVPKLNTKTPLVWYYCLLKVVQNRALTHFPKYISKVAEDPVLKIQHVL